MLLLITTFLIVFIFGVLVTFLHIWLLIWISMLLVLRWLFLTILFYTSRFSTNSFLLFWTWFSLFRFSTTCATSFFGYFLTFTWLFTLGSSLAFSVLNKMIAIYMAKVKEVLFFHIKNVNSLTYRLEVLV